MSNSNDSGSVNNYVPGGLSHMSHRERMEVEQHRPAEARRNDAVRSVRAPRRISLVRLDGEGVGENVVEGRGIKVPLPLLLYLEREGGGYQEAMDYIQMVSTLAWHF